MTIYNQTLIDLGAAVDKFQLLGIDDQLALLWFIYEKMGNSITPAAPGSASSAIVGGLYQQVKQKPQREQLQIQRDIAMRQDTRFSREYGSLSANSKLAFWYYLAQGMEEGSLINVPADYEIAAESSEWLGTIEVLDFEQQITVLREIVDKMGAQPAGGQEI